MCLCWSWTTVRSGDRSLVRQRAERKRRGRAASPVPFVHILPSLNPFLTPRTYLYSPCRTFPESQSSKGLDLSQGALMASLSLPLAPPPPAWQDQLHDSLVKRNAAESAYATIINECECSGSLSDAT